MPDGAPTVFISTDATDAHADFLVEALTERKISVFRFHPEDFPQHCAVTVWPSPDGIDFEIDNGYHRVCRRNIIAAWYRRPGPVQPKLIQPDVDDYVRRQSSAAVRSIYRSLEGLWLASPEKLRIAEDKATQLSLAAKVGLRVPRTCISNDVGHVREFQSALGTVAVKPHHVQGAFLNGRFHFPLTSVWSGQGDDGAVSVAPSIYQEYLDKAAELRIVVIGEQVWAARADIPPGELAVDIRSLDETTYVAHEVPDDVASKLLQMTRALGIHFCSADLLLLRSGEYVFLELNPNGQWLWLEFEAKLPLTDALIRFFTAEAKDG